MIFDLTPSNPVEVIFHVKKKKFHFIIFFKKKYSSIYTCSILRLIRRENYKLYQVHKEGNMKDQSMYLLIVVLDPRRVHVFIIEGSALDVK